MDWGKVRDRAEDPLGMPRKVDVHKMQFTAFGDLMQQSSAPKGPFPTPTLQGLQQRALHKAIRRGVPGRASGCTLFTL